MGSSLSPIVRNIFMEHLEKLVPDTTQYIPSLWLRYVDDIVLFVVWPQGPERLQNFLSHLNNLRSLSSSLWKYVLVTWEGTTLTITV
jgi:hypothetical protein